MNKTLLKKTGWALLIVIAIPLAIARTILCVLQMRLKQSAYKIDIQDKK